VQAVRLVCKLRGGSNPILVEGTNGLLYVLKFRKNPQGPHVLFNEAAGIQLYKSCHLPSPIWEPLNVTKGFIERNRACWMNGPEGSFRPESGLCFGTRFLSDQYPRVFEFLPRASFSRIRSRWKFVSVQCSPLA